ncbi:hypothetical protein [Larkinella sp. C7]|jgi:hypothetical protein|uniref:hypothetical protein n=1 Tax=Larkinella sp. C7 TaxID=2576607 RepID=UPI00111125D8|nr:hypothetical protein [Larkinella sp. C7]
MITANITEGAFADSETVVVSCVDTDGTIIVLFRGYEMLGSGVIASGTCSISVSPLAEGDILVAYVLEQGNRAGIPVVVAASSITVSGWKTPTELNVKMPDGSLLSFPAQLFEETYGYLPASIYDPEGTKAIVYPEYESPAVGGIQFDLTVIEKFNQTLLYVRNVRGIKGNVLVRFDGGSWSGTISKTVTANATVVIDVRGDDDTEFATRSESIVVASEPVTAFVLSRHIDYGNDSLNLINGNNDSVEFRLEPFDMTWRPGIIYQAGETRRIYLSVPNGNYIGWVRFPGDTNPANWGKLEITKG